jgi:hypothetical protein
MQVEMDGTMICQDTIVLIKPILITMTGFSESNDAHVNEDGYHLCYPPHQIRGLMQNVRAEQHR